MRLPRDVSGAELAVRLDVSTIIGPLEDIRADIIWIGAGNGWAAGGYDQLTGRPDCQQPMS